MRRKLTLRDRGTLQLGVRVRQYQREGKPVGPFVAELNRRARAGDVEAIDVLQMLSVRPPRESNPARGRSGPPPGKIPPWLRAYLFRKGRR